MSTAANTSDAGSPVYHFGPHPGNPYAWDVLRPGERPPAPHSSIAGLERVLTVSYYMSLTVGGFLTGLMLYLVLFRTRGEFRPYARMLLLACLSDICYWFCEFSLQIVSPSSQRVFCG